MGFATIDDAVTQGIVTAVSGAIPGAEVEVTHGSGGHYALRVVSAAFAGKSLLDKQRMVYRALAPLMSGPNAPVHAIDRLETVVA
ncbi:MAG: BolA family transcriptional regulator [Deltaproteobacteria bacterium HGW-Deltaproteobacteria-14]|jgi:stress-induced morphogen|nr:MAG: BolA family transcriptional regulator [Deltaproteobacteria bacterium HGW-Deltaproteobacteria-14]